MLDYLTAGIRAVYLKDISASLCLKGVAKKLLYIAVVILATILDGLLPQEIPLRDFTLLFFIATEGLSILQNADGLIPLPNKLRSILLILREKSNPEVKTEDDEESEEDNKEDKIE